MVGRSDVEVHVLAEEVRVRQARADAVATALMPDGLTGAQMADHLLGALDRIPGPRFRRRTVWIVAGAPWCEERVVEGLPVLPDPALYAAAVRTQPSRFFAYVDAPGVIGTGRLASESRLPTVCTADRAFVNAMVTGARGRGWDVGGFKPATWIGEGGPESCRPPDAQSGAPIVTLADAGLGDRRGVAALGWSATAATVGLLALIGGVRAVDLADAAGDAAVHSPAPNGTGSGPSVLGDLITVRRVLPRGAHLVRVVADSEGVTLTAASPAPSALVRAMVAEGGFASATLLGGVTMTAGPASDSLPEITLRLMRRAVSP